MSETRDDLREALARCIEPEDWQSADGAARHPSNRFMARCQGHLTRASLAKADAILVGPLAPILAQVSALQAEVERLQKVEGERGRLERAPKGSGSRPSDQAPAGLAPSGIDPSRGSRQRRDEDGFCCEYDPVFGSDDDTFCVSWDYDARWIIMGRNGSIIVGQSPYSDRAPLKTSWSALFHGPRASDEHPAGEDPKGLSGEAMPARSASADAPSDNPLTETKEGSEHV